MVVGFADSIVPMSEAGSLDRAHCLCGHELEILFRNEIAGKEVVAAPFHVQRLARKLVAWRRDAGTSELDELPNCTLQLVRNVGRMARAIARAPGVRAREALKGLTLD